MLTTMIEAGDLSQLEGVRSLLAAADLDIGPHAFVAQALASLSGVFTRKGQMVLEKESQTERF